MPALSDRRPENADGGISGAWIEPSLLGPTLVLRGELSFEEAVVVRGQVHGCVSGSGSIVIEKGARVSGKITAEEICFEKGVRLDDVVLMGSIRRTPGR